MSRAPFVYRLGRPLEGEAGGAADLQTDIMRFMAILALCLMAIFALVQSLPSTPVAAASQATPIDETTPTTADAAPLIIDEPAALPGPDPEPAVLERPVERKPVAVTRKPVPLRNQENSNAATIEQPSVARINEVSPGSDGFTLRFESDIALSRLVATGQVGVFAIGDQGAQRMSVAANRISFWAAPMPSSYHEMDAATVPVAVREALHRTGRGDGIRNWAVTLPARVVSELQRLMQAHSGGTLVIAKDGSLRREAS